MSEPEQEYSRLRARSQDRGDDAARGELFLLLEAELRKLARALLRSRPSDPTMQTTLLVDEAFVRLVDALSLHDLGRAAFLRVAHGTMRRILVDHGRRRRPQALGPEATATLADARPPGRAAEDDELLGSLADALEQLERRDPAGSAVFLLSFFGSLPQAGEAKWAALAGEYEGGGRTLEQIAQLQGKSRTSVHRLLKRSVGFLQDRLCDDARGFA